jgi:hypothetical protein
VSPGFAGCHGPADRRQRMSQSRRMGKAGEGSTIFVFSFWIVTDFDSLGGKAEGRSSRSGLPSPPSWLPGGTDRVRARSASGVCTGAGGEATSGVDSPLPDAVVSSRE